MRKIKEVSEMAGISRRALQYYDDKGILPVSRSKENYRLYDDEAIESLWEVLFCREMGFGLEEIRLYLDLSLSDRERILDDRIETMVRDKIELEGQISFIETVREKGIPSLKAVNSMEGTYVEIIRDYKNNLIRSNVGNDD